MVIKTHKMLVCPPSGHLSKKQRRILNPRSALLRRLTGVTYDSAPVGAVNDVLLCRNTDHLALIAVYCRRKGSVDSIRTIIGRSKRPAKVTFT